jgi:hypothetical protein
MKKTLFLAALLLLFYTAGLRAQEQDETDRLTAYKIAFFTKKLDLTPAEAEKFWPVYNDYSARKSKIQIDRVTMMRYINQNQANLSEQEINNGAATLTQTYLDESNLTIIFVSQIQKTLPPKKLIKLYQAEAQYKQQLLRELNARRQGNGRPLNRQPDNN